MDNMMVLIPVCIGYVMATLSVFLGAWLAFRFVTSRPGKGIFAPEPKGDVFTVETPDDMPPFPDDVGGEVEDHILKKTNDFLKTLTAGKVEGL